MTTPEFVRIYSKICGDGHLGKRYIRYANKTPELLEEFKRDVLKEFGKITITEGIVNSGTPFLQIQLKPIIQKLSSFWKFDSYNISVPKFIAEGSLVFKREFIRVFYDDEGSPNLRFYNKHKEWKRSITLSSNSLKFLISIKKILREDFNISTNKIIRNRKKEHPDNTWILAISGKNNLTTYERNIGFKSSLKNRELILMIESYGKTYHRNREEFEEILSKLMILKKDKRKLYKTDFRSLLTDKRP